MPFKKKKKQELYTVIKNTTLDQWSRDLIKKSETVNSDLFLVKDSLTGQIEDKLHFTANGDRK